MSRILITGASGFIGRALALELARRHAVVCLSRQDPALDLPWVAGNFGRGADLAKLGSETFDVLVHLGGVTGNCTESDGLLVNVEGTRQLLQYVVEQGCRKCVLASSIATVGLQSPQFKPVSVPIPDDHPCLDRNGYGFSKYLMEEVAHYWHRKEPSMDVLNLRLAAVFPDDRPPALVTPDPPKEWGLATLTMMALSDAVAAFRLAAEASYQAGVRTLNATGPQAWSAGPVAEVLNSWWTDGVDLSPFEQPGHEFDSVFDVRGIDKAIGFVARHLPPR